ncbi:EAL domain-containing protein [Treponema bryantii]|uniref:EAL domain-containing protein n=1 Tax=Treponema bryantii TaxID=163 RepID=UPI0003B798CE|nr:EAL domain-containing protein [Treponema bryantii]
MNSFLFNHIKFQIASITILLILEIIYFLRPKIKLLSNRIFTVLMISAFGYLIFDFATVFALVYYDNLPLWFVTFTHQGFIMFLDIALSSIYLYIDMLNRNQRRYSRSELSLIIASYIVVIASILFAPISYYIEEDGIYSYGIMVNCVYAVLIIYSGMTVFQTLRHIKDKDHRKQKICVLMTMVLWIGFGGIQILEPRILISSVGISAIILLMFLSLENPSEYLDSETRAFNYYALKAVLQEYLSRKRSFAIVSMELDEASIIESYASSNVISEVLIEIRSFIERNFRTPCYRMNRMTLAFIVDNKKISKLDIYLEILADRFSQTWGLKDRSVRLNAHANVLCCPEDFPFDGNVDELLDFAEETETYGRSIGFIRRIDDKAREKRIRHRQILHVVSEAIKDDEIEMFYQPIYSLKEKKFTNAEALVRLKDEETIGFISPEEFIPLSEKKGMIMPLSGLIFNHVFNFMAENNLKSKGVNHIEVNLSGLQSVDANLPKLMKSLLMKHNISPDSVNLEITESIAVTSGYMLKKNMDELRKFGCSFSMDDFGTGYSNLSRIAKADFEMIKIDKSLLWPCFKEDGTDSTQNAKILLENMISMLLKIGRKIVVEGIETKEQFDYLENLGITYAQGFYFSKPIPEEDFLKFIEEKNL